MSTVPAAEPLEAVIGRMAAVISSSTFPTGDRAALRRMVPAQPIPLTFYRFALNYCPSNWQYQRDDWLAITAGIALMSPAAHDPRVGLGAALARHGYSEARLERLLGARGEVRRILFLRAVRFLAAKVQPFKVDPRVCGVNPKKQLLLCVCQTSFRFAHLPRKAPRTNFGGRQGDR